MTVTLGEEIMLLTLDDTSGAAKGESSARWGVTGGILLELVMADRVTVTGGRIEAVDPAPTGDALLDGRLERLARWAGKPAGGGRKPSRGRKAADWLTRDHAHGVQDVLDRLCARGLVTEEKHRALGLFPVRRYPEADGSVERELRDRLASVVVHGAEPDARMRALTALLHAAGLHRQAFPDLPKKRVEPRMAAIAEGQWAGDSVREAILTLQTVMTAVTVVTVVTATS
ncbi:GPP34 family phosphoprotein [Streptomyces sp. NPDC088729]|uniref:GOLPH3/VPS74 family protein n=1 Tax=Streptomyces sp. NPDC088729 TaxID=3365876 RepID=UPI0037FE9CAD